MFLPIRAVKLTKIYIKTNIFTGRVDYFELPQDTTVQDMLRYMGYPDNIVLVRNGKLYKCNELGNLFNEPLQEANWIVLVVPGDEDFRNSTTFKVVASIAIVAAAIYTGNWLVAKYGLEGLAAAAVQATISTAAGWAISQIIPPEVPELAEQTPFQRKRSITGISNRPNPLGPIPKVYGTYRYFPPVAGLPFTAAETAPNKQFITTLLCLGYGPLKIGGKVIFSETTNTKDETVGHDLNTNGPGQNWEAVYIPVAGLAFFTTDNTSPYKTVLRLPSTSNVTYEVATTTFVEVSGDQTFRVKIRFKEVYAGYATNVSLKVRVIQNNGQIAVYDAITGIDGLPNWQEFEGSVYIPAGVSGYASVQIAVGPYNNSPIHVDEVTFYSEVLRLKAPNEEYPTVETKFQDYNLPAETIKIGGTDLANLDGFLLEIGRGDQLALYSKDIHTQSVNADLNATNTVPETSVIWDTADNTTGIDLYLVLPKGAWCILNDDRRTVANTRVIFKVYASKDGGNTWLYLGDTRTLGGKETIFLSFQYYELAEWAGRPQSFKIKVERYRTDPAINIVTTNLQILERYDDAAWVALNSIQAGNNWNLPEAVVMSLRVDASENVFGRLDSIAVLADGYSYVKKPLNVAAENAVSTIRGYDSTGAAVTSYAAQDDFNFYTVQVPSGVTVAKYRTDTTAGGLRPGTYICEVLVRAAAKPTGFTMWWETTGGISYTMSNPQVIYLDGITWKLRAEYTVGGSTIWNSLYNLVIGNFTWDDGQSESYISFKDIRFYNVTTDKYVLAYTNSPAWVYRDALSGKHLRAPIDNNLIDDNKLEIWDAWCRSQDFTFNHIFDGDDTFIMRANQIATAGRASFAVQDGLFTVVMDVKDQTKVQVFTPKNSVVTETKSFVDIPHGVKISYSNNLTGVDDEITIYDTDAGYDDTNARKLVSISVPGVTNYDQAWLMGKYYLRALKLRPIKWTISTGIESIISHRGDTVGLSYDIIQVGLSWGRILEISPDGLTVKLSEYVNGNIGGSFRYGLKIRRSDGSTAVVTEVVSGIAGSDTIQVADDLNTLGVIPGDLYIFGELGKEDIDVKIIDIRPNSDMSATLTVVDAAPEIYDLGRPATYNPPTTFPVRLNYLPPPTPEIIGVESDESVMYRDADGTYRISMVVSYRIANSGVGIEYIIATAKEIETGKIITVMAPIGEGFVRFKDSIEQGKTYSITLRARSVYGSLSGVSAEAQHTIIGKSTPPAPVTGLQAEIIPTGSIKLSWAPNSEPDIAGYIVEDAFGNELTRISGTAVFLKPTSEYRVWAYDSNTPPNRSSQYTSIQVNIALPEVTSLQSTVIDNFVLLSWSLQEGSFTLKETLVKRLNPPQDFGGVNGTFTSIFESVGGTYTYEVIPIDVVGNAGTAKTIQVNVSDPPDFVLKSTFQSNWGGTTNQVLIDNGILYAPQNVTELYGDHFTSRNWTTPQDQVNAGYPLYGQPIPLSTASYQETFDTGAQLAGAKISVEFTYDIAGGSAVTVTPEIQVSSDNVNWTSLGNAWEGFGNNFRYIRIIITIQSQDGKTFIRATSLNIRVYQKLKTDAGSQYYDPSVAGSEVVNFNVVFVDVESIVVTPEYKTSGPQLYAVYEFNDIPYPTSFKVYLYDSNGNRVAGRFSWTVRGY